MLDWLNMVRLEYDPDIIISKLDNYYASGGTSEDLARPEQNLIMLVIHHRNQILFDYLLEKDFDINKHYNFGNAVIEAWIVFNLKNDSYYIKRLLKRDADIEFANSVINGLNLCYECVGNKPKKELLKLKKTYYTGCILPIPSQQKSLENILCKKYDPTVDKWSPQELYNDYQQVFECGIMMNNLPDKYKRPLMESIAEQLYFIEQQIIGTLRENDKYSENTLIDVKEKLLMISNNYR